MSFKREVTPFAVSLVWSVSVTLPATAIVTNTVSWLQHQTQYACRTHVHTINDTTVYASEPYENPQYNNAYS